MPAGKTNQDMVFHSAKQFEALMFPRAVSERVAAHEKEHPRSAGSRLAEEALARLKPTSRQSHVVR